MITIGTATRQGGMKVYNAISAENLEELKKKLLETDHKVVHLLLVDPWEDDWSYAKSDIPVNDLEEKHIKWLEKEQVSEYSSDRYLVCRL